MKPVEPVTIVVMGVSGCGKSTIAQYLAKEIGAHVKDGDELHPASNISKMAAGHPLTDDDRLPWLDDVVRYANKQAQNHRVCVIACSALKRKYRDILNRADSMVAYIFLEGSRDLIASRMHERAGHFMPETLLDSQFEALEDPRSEPNVFTVSIEHKPVVVAHNAAKVLRINDLISQ